MCRSKYSKIIGTGSYLPDRIMNNQTIAEMVDTSDEWIRTRTGITQRHLAAEGQSNVDLAEQAATMALKNASVRASDVDLIIVATTTPDKVFPSNAVTLQHRLGANGCPAFDIQAVCSGFVYALSTADQFVRSGEAKTALVIGSEVFSRILNWSDRSTCVLFGDGAGAVVIKSSNEPGILATELYADGRFETMLHVPGNRSIYADQSPAYVEMVGSEVFKESVNKMGGLVDTTLAKAGVSHESLDWLVPHQANYRIIKSLAKKLKMPMEKVIVTIDKHANTSAASIPLALHQGISDGRIKEGQMVMMEAFGGGFTWGSALLKL